MADGSAQGGSFSIAAEAAAAVRARWSLPPAPSIADILTPAALEEEESLAETLAADAEERRRRGLVVRLEDYLAIAPKIACRPSACRAVLMAEVVGRGAESEDALRADLVGRLPLLAGEIDAVMSLASLFREAAADAALPRGPGTRLGKYVLCAWLGEGAFGEVWQAWDTDLERYVALKILRAAHRLGVRGLQRFLVEVRAAAALDHECVVRVHGAGQFAETGEYYIDTQLVGEASPTEHDPKAIQPGHTLEHRVNEGPTPAREAAALIAAAARGVAAAHARGITHRDLKPSNFLVTSANRPLVADFGLSVSGVPSRFVGEKQGPPGGSVELGHIAGTPAYMSPEQARGEPATPLSDVYSLGATLRALLTGRPPYEPVPGEDGSAREQVMGMVREGGMRSLREVCPGVPATLCAICDRACAADPRSRYSSADQLGADLEAFLNHRPTAAAPPGPLCGAAMWCRRHALTSIVAATGVLMIVGATAGFLYRVTRERDRAIAAEVDASTQRDAAIAARDAVETMNQFLARTFSSTRGLEQSGDISVIDAIRLGSQRVGRTFADRPLVEADVRHFLGQGAMATGHLQTARRELERAWELRRDLLGEDAAETLATRRQIAELLILESKRTDAEAVFLSILEPLRRTVGEDAPDTLRALAFLGEQQRRRGHLEGARRLLDRAAAGYHGGKQYGAIDHQRALDWLVLVYVDLKQLDRAESIQREIIRMNQVDLGPDDISTLNATQALGWILRLQSKHDEAASVYRDVLARYLSTAGPSHTITLHVTLELAATVIDTDPEEAVRLASEVVARAPAQPGGNQYLLRGLVCLGKAFVAAARDNDAEPVLWRALAECIEHRGAEHALSQECTRLLIGILERQGRRTEADALRSEVPLRSGPADPDR